MSWQDTENHMVTGGYKPAEVKDPDDEYERDRAYGPEPTGDWKMNQAVQKAESREVATADPTSLVAMLERLAVNPDVDADKMNRILDVQERILAKQAESEFNASMAAAQQEMGPIAADAENKQTKSKYASYFALDKALRPIYTKHGFALSFDEGDSPKPDYVRELCHVSHRGGHTRTYKTDLPADGKGAKGGDVMTKTHATGSAKSYGKRYLLKDIFNVAIGEDDDDGNSAGAVLITEEQVADLEAKIDEVGATKEKFLKVAKVESLHHIRADWYGRAIEWLERYGKE